MHILIRLLIASVSILLLAANSALIAQSTAPHIDQKHPVFAAIRQGDLVSVKKLLDDGLPINSCTEFGYTLLRGALEAKRPDLAIEIMDRGFDPTLVYKAASEAEYIQTGTIPLSLAAQIGAGQIVDRLLAFGLSAYPTKHGTPAFISDPVHMAIEADATTILKKLLETADPSMVAKKLRSFSHPYLAACKSVAAIDLLSEYGADVDATAQNLPFSSVLHIYAMRAWEDGVTRLLLLGADPTHENDDRQLPEEVARSEKLKRTLRVAGVRTRVGRNQNFGIAPVSRFLFPIEILERAIIESEESAVNLLRNESAIELDTTDDRGWTILNYTLSYKMLRLSEVLMEKGADVSHVTNNGSAIIGFAAATGSLELVKKLAAKRIDIDAAENGSPTALIIATQRQDVPMVEFLLSVGARVDPPRPRSRDHRWSSALMVAARTGNIPLMERLLNANGDIDAVDSSGENVIFWAVRSGNTEALHWLLAHGAYPNLKTPRGTNALTLAASLGKLEMVKTLLELGVTHPEVLDYAEMSGQNETAAYLRDLKKRTNPDDPAEFWKRFDISTEEVRDYIAAGGDVNFSRGTPTPLQVMASMLNAEAVELLLKNGADPFKRGRLANSAVFLCLHTKGAIREQDALSVLRLFIEHGVPVDRQEFRHGIEPPEKIPTGPTLLAYALSLGHRLCAQYLLQRGANPLITHSTTGLDAFDQLNDSHRFSEAEVAELRSLMEKNIPASGPEPGTPSKVKGAIVF